MERPERSPRHDLPFGSGRLVPRVLGGDVDEGGDAGIARLDAFEERVDDLDGGEVAGADPAGHLGRAHVGELIGQGHGLSPRGQFLAEGLSVPP